MRDFHAAAPPAPPGDPVAVMEGDGGGAAVTYSPVGAVMAPIWPGYEPDDLGGTKHEYKAHRARGQATLIAAGRP